MLYECAVHGFVLESAGGPACLQQVCDLFGRGNKFLLNGDAEIRGRVSMGQCAMRAYGKAVTAINAEFLGFRDGFGEVLVIRHADDVHGALECAKSVLLALVF